MSSVDLAAVLPSTLSLKGLSAIVTGSSRGIGVAIAVKLAERGANIGVHYSGSPSSKAKAEATAERVRSFGRKACVVQCDLEDPACGEKIVRAALDGLDVKTIEILVNNAAVAAPGKADEPTDPELFDRVFRVNVKAPALLVAAVLPSFRPTGANRIINICTINSRMNFPGYWLYSSSKAGIDSLTRTWAKELAIKYSCTVNSVIVGPTATEDAPDSEARAGAKRLTTAATRLGGTDDIAETVAWLAGEGSRWTNGDSIGSNGGILIQS